MHRFLKAGIGVAIDRDLCLDEPQGATAAVRRTAAIAAAAIILLAAAIVTFGDVPLRHLPQFVPLQVAALFTLDAVTAFLLFGQFHYRRLPIYAILGTAYLFSSMVTVPFLLSFPYSVSGPVIGGSQSAIWAWHYWHLLFPVLVAVAVSVDLARPGRRVAVTRLWPATGAAILVALILVAAVTLSITVGHDRLTVLIDGSRRFPLTPAFYRLGSIAAAITLVALALALWQARQGAKLPIWLAVVMTAFLADITASLAAHQRYTVGWYFGRIEALAASSGLLLVFLAEIDSLYRRIGRAVEDLAAANLQLSRLALTDGLTGIANRRSFDEILDKEWRRCQRDGHPITLIMGDVDYFKAFNDRYGHQSGDACLKAVAEIMKDSVRRPADLVARYGGEEFAILLPDDDLAGAEAIADRILNRIRARAIPHEGSVAAPVVTVSLGIATERPTRDGTAAALIAAADSRLYQAKEAGRNQVVAGEI